MKSTILALAIFLSLGHFSHAQTSAGEWLAGGSMSMSTARAGADRGTNGRSFGISLSPRVGYFALNRLAVGLVTSASYSREERDFGGRMFSTTSNLLTANVFARYYIRSAKFTPFVQGEFGYSRFKVNMTVPPGLGGTSSGNAEDQGNYSLGAGLAYFVSPQVAIEGTLDWASRSFFQSTADHVLNFRVGLMLYFGKAR
jgi:outer membrane protein